jgi:hypothetical protein
MTFKFLYLFLILAFFSVPSFCQSGLPTAHFKENYITSISSKLTTYQGKMLKAREKAIKKCLLKERSIVKKLYSNDTALLLDKLRLLDLDYTKLDEQIRRIGSENHKTFIPYLDTVKQTLAFLQETGKNFLPQGILSGSQGSKINELLEDIGTIKAFDKQNEVLKRFIDNRFANYRVSLPSQKLKQLTRMNREFEIYQQKVEGFKSVLQDPQKIEKKVISELVKSQPYRQFLKRNSELASFFRLPGNDNSSADGIESPSLVGLQTKETVRASMAEQMGASQVDLQARITESIGNVNGLLEKMKSLEAERERNDSTQEKARQNSQLGKPLRARIEFGFNLQSQRSTNLLPASSELGLSAGYKIDDSRTIGVGASYRWGWGPNLREISITSEGIGLRSFLDWHLWKRIWITGAYECNYHASFDRLRQLNELSAWQQSGLIGITNKYRVGKIKGQIQLFWDFLSYQQNPQTQALKFRVGWSL